MSMDNIKIYPEYVKEIQKKQKKYSQDIHMEFGNEKYVPLIIKRWKREET